MKTINNFKQLNISKELMRALKEMGFLETTPVQSEAIIPMMEKRDVMVQAPTGSGKTCAFGIPTIEGIDTRSECIQAVILCPTRELAIQIAQVLKQLTLYKQGVRIATLYGGERIERQIIALRRRPQIIVATPGRLMDHMRRHTVKLGSTSLVVLDEADRMLDMGFREDMATILEKTPVERQTVLFSATISNEIKSIAGRYQKNTQLIKIAQDTKTVDTVTQFYTEVQGMVKTAVLKKLLNDKKFPLVLVFVNTKSMADALSTQLVNSGFKVAALHGDMRQQQRDSVMDDYRKGRIDILVATDVAARGIDVDNISAVINYDIPEDSDTYVHRIGRTGRANQSGLAYTFIYTRERVKLREIMSATKAEITPVKILNEFEMPAEEFINKRIKRENTDKNSGQDRTKKGWAKNKRYGSGAKKRQNFKRKSTKTGQNHS